MWKSITRYTATWISTVMLLYSFGCILSPKEDPAPPDKDPVVFMDLTEKEHVIFNLELSYAERDIDEFSKLLLKVDDTYNDLTYADGYYFYNQDVETELEEFLLRDTEITYTGNMFLAAKGTKAKPEHQVLDDLTLEIGDGSWMPSDEIFGEPCEDCWYTQRSYELWIYYGEDSKYAMDNIQFYIVPVDEGDVTIYKIAIAKDIYAP